MILIRVAKDEMTCLGSLWSLWSGTTASSATSHSDLGSVVDDDDNDIHIEAEPQQRCLECSCCGERWGDNWSLVFFLNLRHGEWMKNTSTLAHHASVSGRHGEWMYYCYPQYVLVIMAVNMKVTNSSQRGGNVVNWSCFTFHNLESRL